MNKKSICFIAIVTLIAFHPRAFALSIKITLPQDGQEIVGIQNIVAVIKATRCDSNISYMEIAKKISNINTVVSSEVLEAVAWLESEGWVQFVDDGSTYGSPNYSINKETKEKELESTDWGIMQINDKNSPLDFNKWDMDKIKSDPDYNIRAGVACLENKQKYVEFLKRKNWEKTKLKYDLEGHSDQDVLLRAYNGFGKPQAPSKEAWAYVNTVNKVVDKKPWEQQVVVTCIIDEKIINKQSIRLIDQYQHSWDSTSVKDGQHRITAKIPKASEDKISVEVANEKKEEATDVGELKPGEGIVRGVNYIKAWEAKIAFEIRFKDFKITRFGKEKETFEDKLSFAGPSIQWGDYDYAMIDGTAKVELNIDQSAQRPILTPEIVDKKINFEFPLQMGGLFRGDYRKGLTPEHLTALVGMKQGDSYMMFVSMTMQVVRMKELVGSSILSGDGETKVVGGHYETRQQMVMMLLSPTIFIVKGSPEGKILLLHNDVSGVNQMKSSGIIRLE
ncbi:MAG: hypothetical protein AB1439_08545 [candidate division FCPU426 bacterium]